jgi:hypothetical protein
LDHLKSERRVKLTTSKKRRRCLLDCARHGMLIAQVNERLKAECLNPIQEQEWNLWSNYYVGIVKDDPYFEHELIDNDRSLAWFAKQLNQRRIKQITS